MVFMAMAGYDPTMAIEFWQRFSQANAGQEPPEFLSTHPSNARRIRDLKKFLPEALKYYKKQGKAESAVKIEFCCLITSWLS